MITLYTTDCPKCRELKALLNHFNFTYTVNTSVDEMLELGFTKVPMLCVDGINYDFNSAKKWIEENKGGIK